MSPQRPSNESSESSIQPIKTDKIRMDGGTQARYQLYEEIVDDYAEDINQGLDYPPIVVFFDGQEYWLADGFHRVAARKKLNQKKVSAEVHLGTRRDAVLYACGANSTHGLRRTNADKRRAVERLLRDDEWSQWSDREIARKALVSQPFVSKIRGELSRDELTSKIRTVQRGETTYEVDTSNIGQNFDAETRNNRRQRAKKVLTQPEESDVTTPQVETTIITKEETWRLGKSHYLFCGSSDSKKFQRLLPSEIALLIIFPQSLQEWPSKIPVNVVSALSFHTPYKDEVPLDDLRLVVEKVLVGTTDSEEAVVMINLPDPSIFILMDNLGCNCYCAETDPKLCEDALTAWAITNKPSRKLV